MIENNYRPIATAYGSAQNKLDKQFSTGPTLKKALGKLDGKVCLDLGCGKGEYAKMMADLGAQHVYGIDNCKEMISNESTDQITYLLQDLRDPLPRADVVLAPYVLNYADSVAELSAVLGHIFGIMNTDGLLVAVFDEVSRKLDGSLGATKSFVKSGDSSREIEIELWLGGESLLKLRANYFSRQEVYQCMKSAGFVDVEFMNPITPPGVEWEEYLQDPDLMYVMARKR
jgi:SAM-dependent methyltransferase